MVRYITMAITALFFAAIGLNAQSTGGNKEKEELIFVLKHKYPVNIVHQYYLFDSCNVTRIFEGSDSMSYSYQVLTHFNNKAPNRRDDEGFLDVLVSIDSLDYSCTDYTDSTNVSFNTNSDEDIPPFDNNHFMQAMVPVSKEFFLSYSGYNEVVDIYGDRYASHLHRYVKDPKTRITDSVQKFIWVDGVNLDNMAFIADVAKDLLPPNDRISVDSTWRAVIFNKVNGISIVDTVEFKIEKYTAKQYILKGKSIGISLDKKHTLPYKIPLLLSPESISGTGEYEIKMTPRGAIEQLRTKYHIEVKVPVKESYYTEKVKSNIAWVLVGRYKY
jgi:hypothetical protein